ASNFTITGAADLTLSSTAGSVIVNGEEAVADAIQITSVAGGVDWNTALQSNIDSSQAAADAIRILASNAAGGIDIDAGTTGIAVDSTGAISLQAATASDFTVTGAADLTLSTISGSVIVNGGEAVEDAILLDASDIAGGITLQTGGGDITIAATVKEVTSEFTTRSGDFITFEMSPLGQSNLDTGVVPTGANGDLNLLSFQEGMIMEQFIIGTQTIIVPRAAALGLLSSLDLTAADGWELNYGAARANSRHSFTIGTSAAFFMELRFTLADVSGCEPFYFGFRITQANNAAFGNYTDFVGYGVNNLVAGGDCVIGTRLNGGGINSTDTNDAFGDTTTHTLQVLVAADGTTT
ncbi:hypothetical protein LCGC14_3069160, partial [marine sediment metagenome]